MRGRLKLQRCFRLTNAVVAAQSRLRFGGDLTQRQNRSVSQALRITLTDRRPLERAPRLRRNAAGYKEHGMQ